MSKRPSKETALLPDSGFWKGKKVLVTGGSGFLGQHLVPKLQGFGARVIAPRKSEFNLISLEQALTCVQRFSPEYVIHLAAYYGGLGITLTEPGRIYFDNLVMGTNVMEACRVAGVKKLVTIGSACCYPYEIERPLKESDFWSGPLHDAVQFYGHAKKMLSLQGLAYKRQYGFNSIHLIPSNLYGPGDCFEEYRSQVVGALIHKFVKASDRDDSINVWGTGAALREFLFVEDAADGILRAAEKYDDITPLNLGTGVGTKIRELVNLIADCLHFKGDIVWDAGRPEGQAAKVLDVSHMKEVLGWSPSTDLRTGIKKTIDWYLDAFADKRMKRAA